MTNYVWFPVTGDGSAAHPLTWNVGQINWNSPDYWVNADNVDFTNPSVVTGTTPNGSGDSVGLVAGSVLSYFIEAYDTTAGLLNDPYIDTSGNLAVDVLINSGTINLDSMALAGFGAGESAQYPTLDVEGAALHLAGSIVNTATAIFPSPVGELTATGGGTIDIGTGATVEVGGSVQSSIDFNFNGGSGNLLTLDELSTSDTTAFNGLITGFGAGDTIYLPNVPATLQDVTTTGVFNTGVETISIGDPITIAINLNGSGLTPDSVLVKAAGTGIEIVTCFAPGSLIETPEGNVPVEELNIGDLVRTVMGGETQPVVWIGKRYLNCRRHPNPKRVWPVRIAAGAFGTGQPFKDLFVSPNHAIYVDGVLIPVQRLINGTTIRQVEVAEITYFHVELPRHEVLLANGLEVESYLEANDRAAFANASGPVTLHPDFSALAWEAAGCAPLIMAGPKLETVRRDLAGIAARLVAA
jgi:hypothetical protein